VIGMGVWGWLWICWIAGFVLLEGIALARQSYGDTLSEQVWKLFGIGRKDPETGEMIRPPWSWHVQLRRAVLLMGLCWLAAHLLTGLV
jgi:hypothetical protein